MISSSSSDADANTNTNTVTYPCSKPHTLAFEIGGRMFPVDPRDFGTQVSSSSSSSSSSSGDDGGDGDDGDDEDGDGSEPTCSFNLAVTDPPGSGGFLYSWSLGDPFLKSCVLFSFCLFTHVPPLPPYPLTLLPPSTLGLFLTLLRI